MEYVVGQNLSSYLKQGSLVVIQEKTVDNHQQKMQKSKCMQLDGKSECLSESKAAKLMSQILHGLAYMHSRQVCHRDIKLENLIY